MPDFTRLMGQVQETAEGFVRGWCSERGRSRFDLMSTTTGQRCRSGPLDDVNHALRGLLRELRTARGHRRRNACDPDNRQVTPLSAQRGKAAPAAKGKTAVRLAKKGKKAVGVAKKGKKVAKRSAKKGAAKRRA